MLSAFLILMATTNAGGKGPQGGQNRESSGARSRDIPRKKGGWGARNRPPPPNHFLSVRIDNAQIWEKASSLQRDILGSNEHLTGAVIPVQDLHLTLFVLTLNEQDGTLQRAKETLEHCGDILLEHGLSPETESHLLCAAQAASTEGLDGGAAGADNGDEKAHAAQEASHLTLSFRGLGTFRDKVLFARLVDDDQADRFRSLVSALHRRFHEAKLLDARPPKRSARGSRSGSSSSIIAGDGIDTKGANDAYQFEFEPHLTIMKTSKLKDRKTLIPPASYNQDHNRDSVFGTHSPSSLELSSMLEREEVPPLDGWEARPYYKCEQKLALRGPTS